MKTTFITNEGETVAPDFFAVYHNKNGNTFKKIQSGINPYNFSEYQDIVKIELYENGTENLSPLQVDVIHNK